MATRSFPGSVRRLLPILAVVLPLGACASLHGVLVPVSGSVPGASQVDMLVATTRKRVDPTELFSGDRGPTAAFANITVSIPPAGSRQVGEVQWPRQVPGNPATDFVTLKADVIDRDRALAWFHRTLRTVPRRQVLVFIHGFNNRFDDAVFRFAQIVHDSEARVVTDMSADLLRLMSTIGLVIALAVIALGLMTATLNRLRDFAVLKALGARTPRLATAVAMQVLLTVVLASALASIHR